ncbi:MAG: hypothetical protein P8Y80_05020 [Acidobacteriota bacterium]
MDKVWVIKNPYELPRNRGAGRMQPEAPLSDEKNPAKAYSWSVLFWGGSRFYNNQVVKGLSFLSLMVAFYAGTVLTVLSWRGIVEFLRDHGLSVSVFLLAALMLLLCGLIFRGLCCSNSYHGAAKTRKKRFTGTRSRVSPFLCSLLLPGWGQFLNGQPLKGSVFAGFSVVSCFSLVAVPVVLLAWKDLEPSFARFLVESVFTIAVLFLPLIPFVWILGSYDALKISLDEWKKEPLRERLKAVYGLRRNQVWVRRVFRQIKRTFVLVLFLVFLLTVAYNYFPRRFYAGELASTQSWRQTQGMTLLPGMLGRLLS